MPLIKPEYANNFKQLNSIEMCMQQSRAGSLVTHKVVLCAIVSFTLFFGPIMLARYFGLSYMSVGSLFSYSIVLTMIACAVLWYMSKDKTWDDLLLEKLTAYTPVNTKAYNNLQGDVAEKRELDWVGLRAFIVFEKDALLLPAVEKQSLTSFLEKSV